MICLVVSISSGLAARKYKNRCTIKQTFTQQPELKNVINSAKDRSPGTGSGHRFRRNDNVIVRYWLVSKCAFKKKKKKIATTKQHHQQQNAKLIILVQARGMGKSSFRKMISYDISV